MCMLNGYSARGSGGRQKTDGELECEAWSKFSTFLIISKSDRIFVDRTP